ncbi:MAG TPA: ABC transporter permease [Puia sp.]|jgi:putative ABC transport system permease protein|nr:ABC transporter permease [Puia sp.]
MFKNYIKIAWRNLLRNKTFSIINIVGLAMGLSCFLLISLYVLDELSYDKFNPNADRIYRINSDVRFGGTELNSALSSDVHGQMMKKDYPQVEQYTRIYNSSGSKLIKKGNSYINEQKTAHVDSTFFEVFPFPVIAGDTRTALDQPNTVVLTESAAKKYFGTTDVIGKTIETNDKGSTLYKVTAVIKDMPHNGHFNFDFLFSMKNVDYQWGQFTSFNFHTYLLLAKGTDYKVFEKNFDTYTDKYILPFVQQFVKIKSMDEFRQAGNKLVFSLTPLTKIHLYSNLTYELEPNGNIQFVLIFSIVALFILAIACINFMNLTTARSANRAREVGIRKVLGTERKELIIQFLSESTLMVFLSLVIGIFIAWMVLPLFNNVAIKSMHIGSLFSPLILPLLIALPFVVGLLAGSYPAFFLSAFKPIEVLKGKLKLGGKSSSLRSVLVVFQFATSILLIIGTIVIYKQLNYIQTKDIGFKKDQVLIIDGAYSLKNNADAFKNDVLQMNGVSSASFSAYLPVDNSSRSDYTFFRDATMNLKNGLDLQVWTIDYDYVKTLGMQIIKGRSFSKDFGSDSSGVVINETTAKLLGYEDPVGQKIYGFGNNNKPKSYNIIGVVKNFNYESLRQDIGPLCFLLGQNNGLAMFKISTGNINNLISQVENKWKTMAPGMPFSYRFLDESFNDMYRSEQRVGKIVLTFSVLAILIACLGLFGLATFIAEQRTKEIGIRKVLGASVSGIVQLLSKDFVKLVFISFVIAAPLGWYFMHKWLQDFVYRINISWWIFLLAAGLAIFIALATVSFQAIKTALMNPVKSLRAE